MERLTMPRLPKILWMPLSAFIMLGLSSCVTGAPKGEVCVLGDVAGCYDGVTDKEYTKQLGELKGYIARPSGYDEKLAAWAEDGWRKYEECTNGNK
jgi:hypothetical protein